METKEAMEVGGACQETEMSGSDHRIAKAITNNQDFLPNTIGTQ